MMNKRAEPSMMLQFTMGILFTAILILACWYAYTHLFFGPGPEQDLIKTWVQDIKTIEDGRTTQLLTPDKEIKTNIIFGFFSNQVKEEIIVIDDKEYIFKKLGTGAQICAFNADKKRTTFCASADIDDTYIKAFADVAIVSSAEKVSDENQISAEKIFIRKNRGSLYICEDKNACTT